MENHVGWRRITVGFLLALAFGVAAGSLVQTQFNLLALQRLGIDISLGARLTTSVEDLTNFAPLYGVVFGAGVYYILRLIGKGPATEEEAYGAHGIKKPVLVTGMVAEEGEPHV